MTAPYRPVPQVICGTAADRLIRGVLRMDLDHLLVRRVTLSSTKAWIVSIVDTGDGDTMTLEGDTTLHVLWQADEDDAWVEANGERFPIAPGDTMSVPAGTLLRQAAGMLLVEIETRDRSLDRVLPPSHGVETFEGYNRRTDYEPPAAFSLERWKITQPLLLPSTTKPYAVVDLAEPLGIAWPSGTDLIGLGECRIVPAGSGPITLLPDGLGYALVIRASSPPT